jgi:cytochrome c oxidase subunit 6b
MGIEIDGMICEPIAEEEKKEKEEIKLGTCPPDPRFMQQNQTRWCYVMFTDFHRCAHYLGAEDKHCQYFYKCYKSLCPNSWIEKWEEQIEAGRFPRDLTKEMGR